MDRDRARRAGAVRVAKRPHAAGLGPLSRPTGLPGWPGHARPVRPARAIWAAGPAIRAAGSVRPARATWAAGPVRSAWTVWAARPVYGPAALGRPTTRLPAVHAPVHADRRPVQAAVRRP